jgi:hypothetical protein
MNQNSKEAHERARKLRRIERGHNFFDRGRNKHGHYEFTEKAWKAREGGKHEQPASA